MLKTSLRFKTFCLATGAALALAVSPGISLAQTTDDSGLQSSVTAALAKDPALQNQAVTVQIANRVVTLTGTVQTQKQREEAETVAASVPGVSGIQDNLKVTDPNSQLTPPPPPAENQQAEDGSAETAPPPPDAASQSAQPAQQAGGEQNPPPPPPDQSQQARQPYYPPAQPQSGYQNGGYQGYGSYPQPSGPVTVPAGTLLQIRTSEPLNVTKLQDGAVFQATAASDVYEGNVLAIPRGAVLSGTVVKVKKPGALGGSGELELQITSINLGGRVYPVATDIWSSKGPNKAGYTAGNTAAGAVMGAIIGGIVGRGPGAAVGALAGGGAGLLASAETNGPRVVLPPETLLNFHLSGPVTVQPVSWQEAQRLAQSVPRLQRRPVYMAPPYPYPYGYPYPYRVYGW